jgi:hypothetical protein
VDKKHVLHALGAVPSRKLKLDTLDWATSGTHGLLSVPGDLCIPTL